MKATDIQCERIDKKKVEKVCADCTKAFSSFCAILLFTSPIDGHLIHKVTNLLYCLCYFETCITKSRQPLECDRFGKCFHTNAELLYQNRRFNVFFCHTNGPVYFLRHPRIIAKCEMCRSYKFYKNTFDNNNINIQLNWRVRERANMSHELIIFVTKWYDKKKLQ